MAINLLSINIYVYMQGPIHTYLYEYTGIYEYMCIYDF